MSDNGKRLLDCIDKMEFKKAPVPDEAADENRLEPKYYKKYGAPRSCWKHHLPRGFGYTHAQKKKTELYVSPTLWNQILHELLCTEANQKTIASKLGVKPKYVRAVVAEIRSTVPTMKKMDMIGPRQAEILERKVKKRQTQAQIRRALGISKQRVSSVIAALENKFKENDAFRGLGRGGVDSYFMVKPPEPVATPDVNPDYTPEIDLQACAQYLKGLREIIRKRKRERRVVMTKDPFFDVPNNLVEKSAEERMELRMGKAVEAFIADVAEACGVTRKEFISNTIVDLMTRAHLRSIMHVGPPFGPFVHLVKLDDRLLHDKELFDWLLQYYESDLDLDLPTQEEREAEQVAYRESFERDGEVLSQDELAERGERLQSLFRRTQGEERQRLQEQIDKGNVPADYCGCAAAALRWIQELDDGEITAEMLTERFAEHAKYSGWNAPADDGEGENN